MTEEDSELTNGRALARFISWSLEKHQPGDYTMLVLWGHAYRFGIGHTETRAGIDAIDFAELADVLGSLQDERRRAGSDTPKLDIVAFDACDLATVEMTVRLRAVCKVICWRRRFGIPLPPGWPCRSRPRTSSRNPSARSSDRRIWHLRGAEVLRALPR